MITCSKIYTDIPFAHRQHNHKGHCAMIHGHNWSFKFVFGTDELDANGFVIDFGELKWLKQWIETVFDHKLVLNMDDPYLPYLKKHLCDIATIFDEEAKRNFADLTIVANCGAEGLCAFLMDEVTRMLRTATEGRVFLLEVTVFEDSKNSATLTADEFIHE